MWHKELGLFSGEIDPDYQFFFILSWTPEIFADISWTPEIFVPLHATVSLILEQKVDFHSFAFKGTALLYS